MANVTEENVTTIVDMEAQTRDVMASAGKLATFLHQVFDQIRLDQDLNEGRDWDAMVTKYVPLYDTKLSELKALVEALPRWSQA